MIGLKRKTFVWSKKVEMISTFQQNQQFTMKKFFMHVQEQKK